jgi:lipopolysaccharide cholinephosphotransferase
MQDTDLKHVQQVILSIMKDIDQLCTQNGIEYYLVAGSALGAVRHKGFIPWDDDLDILMTDDNYQKFCAVCQTQLDIEKYFFQKALIDWKLNFSKIRLKGTYMEEVEADQTVAKENRGIFIDIFKLDNVSDNKWMQYWQYICAKVWLTYMLQTRTFHSASLQKKIVMLCSKILSIPFVGKFFRYQVEKYNRQLANHYGFFFGRTRFHNAIIKKEVLGKPTRVPFEDMKLPIPEKVDKHLTSLYGDYMQLPPKDKRQPLHLTGIKFGKY